MPPLEIQPSLVYAKGPLPTPPPSATTAAATRMKSKKGELVEFCSCVKKPRRQVRWADLGYTPDKKPAPTHQDPSFVHKPAQRKELPLAKADSRSRTRSEPASVTSPELSSPARALRDRRLRDLVIVYETGAKSRKRPRTSREGFRPPSVYSRPGTPLWGVQRVSVKDQVETSMDKIEAPEETRVDFPCMSTRAAVQHSASRQPLNASARSQPHPLPTPPLSGDSHQPNPLELPLNIQDLASLPRAGQAPDPYFAARIDFLRLVAERIGLVPQVVVAPCMSRPTSVPCVPGGVELASLDPRLERTEEQDLDTGHTKRRRVEAPISRDPSSAPSRQVPTVTVNPRVPRGISWMLNPETLAESSGAGDKSAYVGVVRPKLEVVDLTGME